MVVKRPDGNERYKLLVVEFFVFDYDDNFEEGTVF